MCDLKSFSFLHHFGSGFKYFSATIIRKLSKMLNLRLSEGTHIQIYIHIQWFCGVGVFLRALSSTGGLNIIQWFLEKSLRERICRKVSESLVYLCIFVHFSLELVSRFKSGKGGGMVAVKHSSQSTFSSGDWGTTPTPLNNKKK